MKKIAFLFVFLLPMVVYAQDDFLQVQEWDSYDVGWWATTNDPNLTITFMGVEDSVLTIRLDMDASPYSNTWPLFVWSKVEDQITIKWMKSQLRGDRMVLGDMRMYQINAPIPDDIIYSKGNLYKKVTSVLMAQNQFSRPLKIYDAKTAFKKTKQPQYGKADVIFCVEYQGKERLYKFTLNAVYNGKRPKKK